MSSVLAAVDPLYDLFVPQTLPHFSVGGGHLKNLVLEATIESEEELVFRVFLLLLTLYSTCLEPSNMYDKQRHVVTELVLKQEGALLNSLCRGLQLN